MTKTPQPEVLRPYRTLGLTLLQFMGLLGLIGLVLAIIVHYVM